MLTTLACCKAIKFNQNIALNLLYFVGILPEIFTEKAVELENINLVTDLKLAIKIAIKKESHDFLIKLLKSDGLAYETALYYASRIGNTDLVNIINQNTKNMDWYFCLLGASRSGHANLIKLALLNGAKTNYFVVYKVIKSKSLQSAELVLDNENYYNFAFEHACKHGFLDQVRALHGKKNIDLDQGLAMACYNGHVDVVYFLLDNGAKNWRLGFDYAYMGKQDFLMRLMLFMGAEENNK